MIPQGTSSQQRDIQIGSESLGIGLIEAQISESDAIFVLQSNRDLPNAVGLLLPEHQSAIAATDFDSQMVLLVFVSRHDPPGALVQVEQVSIECGRLKVVGKFGSRPESGNEQNSYEVIRLRKTDSAEPFPASWLLLDQRGSVRSDGGTSRDGLPFESISQAAPISSAPASAIVYIAGTMAETAAFRGMLTAADQTALTRVPWSARLIVAVFRGAVGMNGFAIAVQQVRIDQERLKVTALLKDPPPEGMGRPAFTSPYHLITLPKNAFPNGEPKSWLLEDTRGRVLAANP